MRAYESYMERQRVTPALHDRLLTLEAPQKKKQRVDFGTLAACAAVLIIVAAGWLIPWQAPHSSGPGGIMPSQPSAAGETPTPVESRPVLDDSSARSFVVAGKEVKARFYMMPAIHYGDITDKPQVSASRAYAPGAFTVDMSKEDIQRILWGADGKPEESEDDLPWALYWTGYTVHGYVWYDGEGKLTELTVYGEKDLASFTLELRPGALPFSCTVDPDRETSEAFGVPVTGWSRVYDRDGDGKTDYICGSEFMAGDIGVRFESRNSGRVEDGLDGEVWFNTLFVRQALPDGLYLEHLMTAQRIPAWRLEKFDTIDAALTETDFAPYLPKSGPQGYNEFASRLNYQEGNENYLFVRWSKYLGYDDVEVTVYLPEDPEGYPQSREPVDVSVPESYDWRLYDIPICDNVPKEYQQDFYKPTFRAGDMSLEVVKARMNEHDTGGEICHFYVRHANGVVVSYDCSGVSAEYVWSLVEPTLDIGG